jgi:hypothetical protein
LVTAIIAIAADTIGGASLREMGIEFPPRSESHKASILTSDKHRE